MTHPGEPPGIIDVPAADQQQPDRSSPAHPTVQPQATRMHAPHEPTGSHPARPRLIGRQSPHAAHVTARLKASAVDRRTHWNTDNRSPTGTPGGGTDRHGNPTTRDPAAHDRRVPLHVVGHSLEIDNIIASTAMEGGVLDDATIEALGQIERGERRADDVVEELIARARAHHTTV